MDQLTMKKLRIGFAAAGVIALATFLAVQHHTNVALQAENERLRQQTNQMASLRTKTNSFQIRCGRLPVRWRAIN